MKIIITLLSILFLLSCNEQTKVKENRTETLKYTKFETFLKQFLYQNPKWDNNQKTIKETSREFKKELIRYFKNNEGEFWF